MKIRISRFEKGENKIKKEKKEKRYWVFRVAGISVLFNHSIS